MDVIRWNMKQLICVQSKQVRMGDECMYESDMTVCLRGR